MRYANKECNQFVKDMEDAGLELRHYRGRWFWEGPAVACDDLQDVLSNTKVRCQWDHLGLGWIVYPVAKGGPDLDEKEDSEDEEITDALLKDIE